MKKIAILTMHLGFGGVERAITNLANILCHDFEVELVVTYHTPPQPAFQLDDLVKIKYLTELKPNKAEIKLAIRTKNIFSLLKEGFKSIKILYLRKKTMVDYIKKSDADIIISSRILYTNLLSKYAKANVVTIAQEHRHHNNDAKYIRNLKNACQNIDYLMPVSKELTKFYEKKMQNNRTRVMYIPHCIEHVPAKPSTLETKNIISIGRMSREKGFLDLIDVYYIVHKKHPQWKLNIIGDGDELEAVKNKIKDLGLQKDVVSPGFKDKDYINKLLEDSSIYVMCSFEESFGIVLLEAESYGIPCIAFDSAQGAHEIIDNERNGYLIKNRSKKLMANKICDLIENKKLRQQLGLEARKDSKHYSFEVIKEKWLNFLDQI